MLSSRDLWIVQYCEHMLDSGDGVDANDVVDLVGIIRKIIYSKQNLRQNYDEEDNWQKIHIHEDCEMCAEDEAEHLQEERDA